MEMLLLWSWLRGGCWLDGEAKASKILCIWSARRSGGSAAETCSRSCCGLGFGWDWNWFEEEERWEEGGVGREERRNAVLVTEFSPPLVWSFWVVG